MGKSVLSTFIILCALSASATTYRNITSGTPVWSDPNSWYINETSELATTPPAAGDTIYAFYNQATPDNPFKLYVDVDAAVARINTNYTAGSTAYQLNTLDAATATSLTIDAASADSNAILLSFSSGDNITSDEAFLGFDGIAGSQLKLTNSLNKDGAVNFRFSGMGKIPSRTISIGQNVSVLADKNLYFYRIHPNQDSRNASNGPLRTEIVNRNLLFKGILANGKFWHRAAYFISYAEWLARHIRFAGANESQKRTFLKSLFFLV